MTGRAQGRPLRGELLPPGDKSISHRALLFPSLSTGKSRIKNLLHSEDVEMTRRMVTDIGVLVEKEVGEYIIHGRGRGGLCEPGDVVYAGNSGTTMRIGAGFLAAIDGISVITGDEYLRKRPVDRVVQPLKLMGATLLARGEGRFPPLVVRGGKLREIRYEMPQASAQVKSSIFAAAAASGGLASVREPHPSRDHTERMLGSMGGYVSKEGAWLTFEPPERLEPVDISIPGDFSSASFFIVGALVTPGSEIIVKDVLLNPLRCGLLSVLRRMGARIDIENIRVESGEEVGNIIVRNSELKGTAIGEEEIPALVDEVPILSVAASFASGETEIRGASELRVKESDRISAMVSSLSSLGVKIEEMPDGMVIRGGAENFAGGHVSSFGDHRVAMALEIFSRAAGVEVEIDRVDCISTSFPGFYSALEGLLT